MCNLPLKFKYHFWEKLFDTWYTVSQSLFDRVLKEIKTSSSLYYCSDHSPWMQKTIFRSKQKISRHRKAVFRTPIPKQHQSFVALSRDNRERETVVSLQFFISLENKSLSPCPCAAGEAVSPTFQISCWSLPWSASPTFLTLQLMSVRCCLFPPGASQGFSPLQRKALLSEI